MGFREDWARASSEAMAKVQTVFVNSVASAYESIVDGSAATGAPGQPVDTGFLRASWQLQFLDKTTARISTNCVYAQFVEDNVRGVTFRNHGPHSVKLTVAGFARIVALEASRAGFGGSGNG